MGYKRSKRWCVSVWERERDRDIDRETERSKMPAQEEGNREDKKATGHYVDGEYIYGWREALLEN